MLNGLKTTGVFWFSSFQIFNLYLADDKITLFVQIYVLSIAQQMPEVEG